MFWEHAAEAALTNADYAGAVEQAGQAGELYQLGADTRSAARAHVIAGQALRQWGRHAQAREQLTAAVGVLRDDLGEGIGPGAGGGLCPGAGLGAGAGLGEGIGVSEGFWPGIAGGSRFGVAIAGRLGTAIVAELGEPVADLRPAVLLERAGVV